MVFAFYVYLCFFYDSFLNEMSSAIHTHTHSYTRTIINIYIRAPLYYYYYIILSEYSICNMIISIWLHRLAVYIQFHFHFAWKTVVPIYSSPVGRWWKYVCFLVLDTSHIVCSIDGWWMMGYLWHLKHVCVCVCYLVYLHKMLEETFVWYFLRI